MTVVVLDTNVYVSALVFRGQSFAALERASLPPLAGAAVLVTGDRDLLTLHPFEGISVVTPGAFVRMGAFP